jgi:MFS family permease
MEGLIETVSTKLTIPEIQLRSDIRKHRLEIIYRGFPLKSTDLSGEVEKFSKLVKIKSRLQENVEEIILGQVQEGNQTNGLSLGESGDYCVIVLVKIELLDMLKHGNLVDLAQKFKNSKFKVDILMENGTIHDLDHSARSEFMTKAGVCFDNYRFVILGLIFFITIINYLDRSALSYAVDDIQKEYGVTKEQYGIISSAFSVGYLIMSFFGGLMVDRWGSRKVWSAAAASWSLCTCLYYFTDGFLSLFFIRAALGMCEGPHFPAMARSVADWMHKSESVRANSLSLAATPFSMAIGAPIITGLIYAFGWKMMTVFLGSLGFIWVFLWVILFRDYPENSSFVSKKELLYIRDDVASDRKIRGTEIRKKGRENSTATWRFILLNPALVSNNIGFFAFGYVQNFAFNWLPVFFSSTFSIPKPQIGEMLTGLWITVGIMYLVGGYISDYLWQKTKSLRIARSYFIIFCFTISSFILIIQTFVDTLLTTIILLTLGLGFALMPASSFFAVNIDLAKEKAATSLGVMIIMFSISGILSPILTGILVQNSGNFKSVFYVICGVNTFASIVIFLFQKPGTNAIRQGQKNLEVSLLSKD